MTDNRFIEKFKRKSDSELEGIAKDSKSFVFDARYAAITILKDRNYDSPIIKQLEKKGKDRERAKREKTESLKQQDQRLIRRIRQIPIKETGKYRLENGNELQVKRLNEDNFQVRIEVNYGGILAPVMICQIKGDSTYHCYPFLYLKSILIYGLGGTVLTIILFLLGYVKNDALIFFLPIIGMMGLQLILMPFVYFVLLNFFRKRLRIR